MQKLILVCAVVIFAIPSFVTAGPAGIEINGNIKMTNGGTIEFPDGSIQTTATLQGPQGIQGIQGPQGLPNSLTIGMVTSGSQAAATLIGAAPNQVLNLVLPQGPQGIQGPQGEPGLSCGACTLTGTIHDNMIGTWNAENYPQSGLPETASITFRNDGSFSIDSGNLSILGPGQSSQSGLWQVLKESVIQIKFSGYDQLYLMVAGISSSKVVLQRFGNVTVMDKEGGAPNGALSLAVTAPTESSNIGTASAIYTPESGKNPMGVQVTFSTDRPDLLTFSSTTVSIGSDGLAFVTFTAAPVQATTAVRITATAGELSTSQTILLPETPGTPPPFP